MNLLVFDLETTGLNSKSCSIVSISAKFFNKNRELVTSFSAEGFNKEKHINLQALLINRYKISKLQGLCSENEMLLKFCDWLLDLPRDEEIVIGGHNVHFDIDFIKTRLAENHIDGFDQVASYRVIDSAGWGRLLVLSGLLPENSKVSLSGLSKALGIPYDATKHHNSDYDVELTSQLIFKIIDIIKGLKNG